MIKKIGIKKMFAVLFVLLAIGAYGQQPEIKNITSLPVGMVYINGVGFRLARSAF